MNQLSQAVLNQRRTIINAVNASSAALAEYVAPHRNEMGLTSDEIRKSEKYLELQREYNRNLAIMRQFYAMYPLKKYKAAFAAETKAHYGR